MLKKVKYILIGSVIVLLLTTQSTWAANSAISAFFENPLAVTLITLMLLLLIAIGVLARVLVRVAGRRRKRMEKNRAKSMLPSILVIGLLCSGSAVFAQETGNTAATTTATNRLFT
jgi:hypothetical protein